MDTDCTQMRPDSARTEAAGSRLVAGGWQTGHTSDNNTNYDTAYARTGASRRRTPVSAEAACTTLAENSMISMLRHGRETH